MHHFQVVPPSVIIYSFCRYMITCHCCIIINSGKYDTSVGVSSLSRGHLYPRARLLYCYSHSVDLVELFIFGPKISYYFFLALIASVADNIHSKAKMNSMREMPKNIPIVPPNWDTRQSSWHTRYSSLGQHDHNQVCKHYPRHPIL